MVPINQEAVSDKESSTLVVIIEKGLEHLGYQEYKEV